MGEEEDAFLHLFSGPPAHPAPPYPAHTLGDVAMQRQVRHHLLPPGAKDPARGRPGAPASSLCPSHYHQAASDSSNRVYSNSKVILGLKAPAASGHPHPSSERGLSRQCAGTSQLPPSRRKPNLTNRMSELRQAASHW